MNSKLDTRVARSELVDRQRSISWTKGEPQESQEEVAEGRVVVVET